MEALQVAMKHVVEHGSVPENLHKVYRSVLYSLSERQHETFARWALRTYPKHIHSNELMKVVFKTTSHMVTHTHGLHAVWSRVRWATRVLMVGTSRVAKADNCESPEFAMLHVACSLNMIEQIHRLAGTSTESRAEAFGLFAGTSLLSRRIVCILHRERNCAEPDTDADYLMEMVITFLGLYVRFPLEKTSAYDREWLMRLAGTLLTHPLAADADETGMIDTMSRILTCAKLYEELALYSKSEAGSHPMMKVEFVYHFLRSAVDTIKGIIDRVGLNDDMDIYSTQQGMAGVFFARLVGVAAETDPGADSQLVQECVDLACWMIQQAPAMTITRALTDMYIGIMSVPDFVARGCVKPQTIDSFIQHLRATHESDMISQPRVCFHAARLSAAAVKAFGTTTQLASAESMQRAADCAWLCALNDLDTETALISYMEAVLELSARTGGNAHHVVRNTRVYKAIKPRWPRHNALVYLSLYEKARACVYRQPKYLVEWKRFHKDTLMCDHVRS